MSRFGPDLPRADFVVDESEAVDFDATVAAGALLAIVTLLIGVAVL